jgi:serine/threonine-protein kinase
VLEKELGRGGMATVYLARDLRHDRHVALKVLRPELAAALGPERFVREVRTTARLQHPHILPVLESGESLGQLWYTMPYVRGESLRDRLRREAQLQVDVAVDLARQVSIALDYAHREGVVHRDLKPENILLSEGQALVADFGVAKALSAGGESQLTEAGMSVGTPAYMSPEQASAGQVDGRSDIYALGCVLYEMLAGEPPFTGRTPQAILAKRVLEPVPHVRTVRENVPEPLEQAITRALAKAPADRFATAGDFAHALANPLFGAATASTPVGLPGFAVSANARSRRAFVLGLGAVVALGLGLAAVFLWPGRTTAEALDPNRLAVAPFDVLDPGLQFWREGLVDLLARNLDGAGPLRTIPPSTVIRRWNGRADLPSATELGRRTGARLTVVGSLVPAGSDSARLRATLYDVATGRLLAELELRDIVGRIDRLSDSLTVRLLAELGRARRLELTRVASLGSTSLPALKAFLEGEQWFRRAAWDSALAAYERAVALDSSFALAHWRLGRVLGWQRIGGDSLAAALSLRAGALNRGLAPRDSLLILIDSISAADVPPTWEWYKRLRATALEAVRRYQDDADAWHTLGEVYEHAGMGRGVSVRQTLAAFERAIALDSAYAPAYIHAIEDASRLHGLEAASRYALEYLRHAPSDVTAEGIRLALTQADPATGNLPEAERALKRASANVLFKAWLPFYGATDSGEVAVRVARALAASSDSAQWIPNAIRRSALVFSLSYRGHLQEAAVAWRPDIPYSSSLLAEISLLAPTASESAGRYFSQRLRAGDITESRSGLAYWASRGDSGSIIRFQVLSDSLAHSDTHSWLREHGQYGSAAARAYLTLVRRDTAEALRRFEDLPDSLCLGCFSESLTRLLLWSTKRFDQHVVDAQGPWSYFPSASEVIARLEQARAAERLGNRDRAIAGYNFVAEVWRHADQELQPYALEARTALGRLTAETRR